MAREYQEFPREEVIKPAEYKSLRFTVMKICQAGQFENPEEQEKFTKYFKYKIAELTWIANVPDLPKKVTELKKQDLFPSGRAPNPQVHDLLNGMLLAATSGEKVVVLTADDPECVVGAKIK